jgi:capsular exopolysaccharide synthesis family protein
MGESFRFALTSILLSEHGSGGPRIIALTSANPGEGKTTVTTNLAIALARVGRRVLLIDGDIRKPRLHEILDVSNSEGLCEALDGSNRVNIQETRIPNLFLLPSGRNADERVFFTSRLCHLLQSLRSEFDMILIDTPPMLQMSDARLLGHHADAVIVVVAQHTTRAAVLLVQQRLVEDGTRLLGTILNKWNPKEGRRVYCNGTYYESSYSSRQ